MQRSYPPSPLLSTRSNEESSVEDYDDALLDIDDAEMEYTHEHTVRNFEDLLDTMNNQQSRPSSATTGDWEEPESWITSGQNSESCPVSTPGSSSGASPLTGTSSQGVSPGVHNTNEQAFPFSIPEDVDQSLSSISDVLQVEKDFMEYVMSFPLNVSNVPPQLLQPTPVSNVKKSQSESNAKVGLDHLDNLCKLMEQLSDLKEANIKLKRRVQYLEDIKTLHEIHKEMVGERKLYSSGLSEDEVQQIKQKLDESTVMELSEDSQADSQSEADPSEVIHGLYRSKTANQIPSTDYKCERGHKSRSSVINKERRERSKSVGHPSHTKGLKKRPSRWSKVKEVLGIDKTDEYSTGGEAEKSDEKLKKDNESLSRKGSEKSKSSVTSTKSHSNVLSSRSFSEAERQNKMVVVTAKKSGTLDSKTAQSAMEQFEKEEAGPKKSPKSPWGKMKTMIQIRRDNRQQKSESSSSSPRDAKSGNKPSAVPSCDRRTQRTLHKSSFQDVGNGFQTTEKDVSLQNGQNSNRSPRHNRLENGISDNSRRPQKSPQKSGHRKISNSLQAENNGADENQKKNMDERDNCFGEKANSKENGKRKKSKPRPIPLDYVKDDDAMMPCGEEEINRSLGLSPRTQKKWMWTKMKGVLKGKREEEGLISHSVPSSPSSAAECLSFDFDLEKTKEEENSIYETPRVSQCAPCAPGIIPSSSPSITVTELLRELQQNLSDDFNKKLEEWQRCRAEGIHKVPSPQIERKDSFGRMRKISKPEKKVSTSEKIGKSNYHLQKKDLSWLEKEQQKVDREIIRLSKEKQKYEKRAFRLKQLKENLTDGDGQKKEVLVKTSAGEFRFEGISDDFTKKLYEWETKKGVNPELSTIALLDKSLKVPTEASLAAPCSSSVGSNSTRPSPEPPKSCYQVSRASSEPDLSSTQKETNSNNQATRSKSGDTLLAGETEIVANLEDENPSATQQTSKETILHIDDNYYSLLEENMYLLDQLKEKEEICNHLQNELDRLDDKTEKTNRTHQEEMEKYRQKLWEIHMSRPRDLQGSLHLISELKSRIEELQKCSDKLKSDRERLEDSFRFHSNQQARLADDLIRRVRELQETGILWGINRGGYRRKWRKLIKCDQTSISRIHELSTKLLQQARDVEQTLMERTRQVCHLRWELLHRDMSAVLLQAALHRVTSQGEPVTILPTWDKRRNRFKNIKAWSVDTTTRRPSEDLVTDDWLQERLRQLSMTPYNDWANIDFSPNDLMVTAHELKKETLSLAIARPDKVSDSEDKKSATCSAESEIADSDRYYDTGSAVNSRSSSFSSGPGGLRGSHSDTRLYERTRALRRNSSSSMSCVEASDSSSIHDSDKVHFLVKKFPWKTQWRSLDNVSSSCSSRSSSVLDDETNKFNWKSAKSTYRDVLQSDETAHSQLQVKYGSFKEVDEETEELKTDPSDWGNHCLITPKPMHLARISDTESDKHTHSPSPFSCRLKDAEYDMCTARSSGSGQRNESSSTVNSYKDAQSCSWDPKPSYPSTCYLSTKASVCGEYENYSEQNLPYKSATEGSMESLNNYETAIRDEELSGSDEQNIKDILLYKKDHSMETFSEFEKDLKQRVIKNSPSVSNVSSFSQHSSISDYIDRDKPPFQISSGSIMEQSNNSSSSSLNITKFKYKGTKGFGHSPRMEYGKIEENSTLTFPHLSTDNCESSNDSYKLGS